MLAALGWTLGVLALGLGAVFTGCATSYVLNEETRKKLSPIGRVTALWSTACIVGLFVVNMIKTALP